MPRSTVEAPEVEAPRKAGRQEIRTRETRELLLRAAKIIFIRDGYEGADLKDIADLADRTKGAIYGHFKGKEEIFLALIAEHRQEYREKLQQRFSNDVHQNVAVMRQFVIELANDKQWALLHLEFKMFTLRHPETKKQYQNLLLPLTPDREASYVKLMGAADTQNPPISRNMALHSIFPMLSALLLEAEFEPELMTESSIQMLIAKVFDCLIGS